MYVYACMHAFVHVCVCVCVHTCVLYVPFSVMWKCMHACVLVLVWPMARMHEGRRPEGAPNRYVVEDHVLCMASHDSVVLCVNT